MRPAAARGAASWPSAGGGRGLDGATHGGARHGAECRRNNGAGHADQAVTNTGGTQHGPADAAGLEYSAAQAASPGRE